MPMSLADHKVAAERIVTSYPQWSNRMVAEVTGIAAKTVAKIRYRSAGPDSGVPVQVGQSPVPARRSRSTRTTVPTGLNDLADWPTAFDVLEADPSLRSSEMGQVLLRMLSSHCAIEQHGPQLQEAIPAHSLARVATVACGCADAWRGFAERATQQYQKQLGSGVQQLNCSERRCLLRRW
jgi:hypothetical protein